MQPTIKHLCPICDQPLACTFPPGGQWECLTRDCGYSLIDLHGIVTTKEQLEAYRVSGQYERDLAALVLPHEDS